MLPPSVTLLPAVAELKVTVVVSLSSVTVVDTVLVVVKAS